MRTLLLRALLGLLGVALFGCAERPQAGPRLLLVYAPCTVSRAYLEPYAPSIARTPHLARFAQNGAVFLDHHTESGESSLAYASILTGMHSDGHGVYQIPQHLADEPVTLFEAFRDAGWDVHAWLDQRMASAELNFAQGVPEAQRHDTRLQPDDAAFRAVLTRLSSDPDYRALVVTNFTVTHGPYESGSLTSYCQQDPGPCQPVQDPGFQSRFERYHRNHLQLSFNFPETRVLWGLSDEKLAHFAAELEVLYASNVTSLDEHFGAVLAAIEAAGVADVSLVAFTADHGELLYRANSPFLWSHSMHLAPEVIRVPLVLRGPVAGVRPARLDFVTRSIDVFPTLAGLAGVPIPEGVTGVDLAATLRGEAEPPELLAYSHTGVLSPSVEKASRAWKLARRIFPRSDPSLVWASVRRGDLVWRSQSLDGQRFEVVAYDWAHDPGEATNLYDPSDPGHREMGERLAEYKRRLVRGWAARIGVTAKREAELLRSLGYID